MKYNYVIFSWLFSEKFRVEEDYYAICLYDLEGKDNIIINHYPLQGKPYLLRFLYKTLHSRLFYNRLWKFLPSIWYPFIFENKFKDDKPICFVCIRYPEVNYLQYLKRKYKNCKVVVLCRDVLQRHIYAYNRYTPKGVYDFWMSFDEDECKKYGFKHFDEFESKVPVEICDDYPLADVFFAGRAKDRLQKLLDIYDKLTSHGVKCLFLILDGEHEKSKERSGFRFLKEPITYAEMLRLSVNSRCILDINQSNATGYTSRFLEAVMFNKKLITDNFYIKKSKFYNPLYIQLIHTENDLDVDFVKKDVDVDYHYSGEFSPVRRLELIEQILVENNR